MFTKIVILLDCVCLKKVAENGRNNNIHYNAPKFARLSCNCGCLLNVCFAIRNQEIKKKDFV